MMKGDGIMYCIKCGATNDDQARFCRSCGITLQAAGVGTGTPAALFSAVQYAGFWRRLGASLLDGLLLGVVVLVIYVILILWAELIGLIVGYIAVLILGWLYYALMESSSRQATLGKMALGIIVTDTEGQRVSFARATGRHFGKIVSGIILDIGYIMIAFTEKKQGLHDIMANCLVVIKK